MDAVALCPACDSASSQGVSVFETKYSYDRRPFSSRIVRCRCGHSFLNPRPDWEELKPFYGGGYHCFESSPAESERLDQWVEDRKMGDRFNHVRVVPGGRYLDIGCGTGDMVAAMAKLGMEAEGVEPSEFAAAKARKAGLNVTCAMLHDAKYPDSRFDSVSMFHVLEHVPDPVDIIRECKRILKPGGELVVGVPNFDSMFHELLGANWIGLQLPTHLHHFSTDSIRLVAEKAGLSVQAVKTESLPGYTEGELAQWLRYRFLVPQRISMGSGLLKAWAIRISRKSELSGRGDSIVATLEND